MSMTIVNGRVEEHIVEQAKRTLAVAGLTVSEVIRNTLESIALTGNIPMHAQTPDKAALQGARQATAFFASQDTPGRVKGVSDEELLAAERMERFGY